MRVRVEALTPISEPSATVLMPLGVLDGHAARMYRLAMHRGWGGASIMVLLAACSEGAPPLDAGARDASAVDAGARDASAVDAPWAPADAGPLGGPLAPTDPCASVADTLYRTPPGLGPFSPSARGTLLGCALRETIPAAAVRSRLGGIPGLAIVGGDLRVYLVAYRTEHETGVGAISTALVVLPSVTASERVPLVLSMHGSVGVADACAPSRLYGAPSAWLPASYVDALVLSWAARGLPVVAPDYAGLGTDGVHGYGNWVEPTRSALDGARALRGLLPAARLDGTTLVYGHSQGGGLALAVAAAAAEAPDLRVSAVVAAAPGYRLAASTQILRLSGFTLNDATRTAVALTLFADLSVLAPDGTHDGDAFAPAVREHVVTAARTLCYGPLVTALATPAPGYVPPRTVGDLVDPAFASAVLACVDRGACDGLPGAFARRDAANEPRTRAGSPPILIAGSFDDEIVTPAVLGCTVDRVGADGASFDVCMVEGGSHLAMMSAVTTNAIDWAIAAARGAPRPPCPGSTTAPRCRLF